MSGLNIVSNQVSEKYSSGAGAIRFWMALLLLALLMVTSIACGNAESGEPVASEDYVPLAKDGLAILESRKNAPANTESYERMDPIVRSLANLAEEMIEVVMTIEDVSSATDAGGEVSELETQMWSLMLEANIDPSELARRDKNGDVELAIAEANRIVDQLAEDSDTQALYVLYNVTRAMFIYINSYEIMAEVLERVEGPDSAAASISKIKSIMDRRAEAREKVLMASDEFGLPHPDGYPLDGSKAEEAEKLGYVTGLAGQVVSSSRSSNETQVSKVSVSGLRESNAKSSRAYVKELMVVSDSDAPGSFMIRPC